eukprot:Gb_17925 [translate_table: standard]
MATIQSLPLSMFLFISLLVFPTINAVEKLFLWPKQYVLTNKPALAQRPAVEGTFRIAVDSKGNAIISPNADCALGFLDHNNSGQFTLSIVFTPLFSSPKGTQIWSANRNRPVGENARLMRSTNGSLVLVDSDGTQVWSSGQGSVESMELGDAGNWVLYNTSNANLANQDHTLWFSWQHPTDTLMIGQIFRTGQRLVSNASPTNRSEGRFSLVGEKGGLVLYTSQSLPYWVWAFPGLSYEYIKNPCTSGSLIAQAVYAGDLISLGNIGNASINATGNTPCAPTSGSDTLPFARFKGEFQRRFVRLDSDGNLRDYKASAIRGIIGDNPQEWAVDYELFPSCFNCSLPTVCGPYGVCSNGQCSCPAPIFEMKEPFQPNGGCSPPRPLSLRCQGRQKMLEVKGLDYYPNKYINHLANASTAALCKAACVSNCTCVAAFFHSDASPNSCFLAFDTVDSLQFVDPNRRAFRTAFLKVQET